MRRPPTHLLWLVALAAAYTLVVAVSNVLVDKFSHVRFEPSGMTKNPEVRFAKSIVDYIFRWMASKFLSEQEQFLAGVNGREADDTPAPAEQLPLPSSVAAANQAVASASCPAASAVRWSRSRGRRWIKTSWRTR